ncbi:hypothetical protein H312_01473, partial [Anncaliia algerae PRA339]
MCFSFKTLKWFLFLIKISFPATNYSLLNPYYDVKHKDDKEKLQDIDNIIEIIHEKLSELTPTILKTEESVKNILNGLKKELERYEKNLLKSRGRLSKTNESINDSEEDEIITVENFQLFMINLPTKEFYENTIQLIGEFKGIIQQKSDALINSVSYSSKCSELKAKLEELNDLDRKLLKKQEEYSKFIDKYLINDVFYKSNGGFYHDTYEKLIIPTIEYIKSNLDVVFLLNSEIFKKLKYILRVFSEFKNNWQSLSPNLKLFLLKGFDSERLKIENVNFFKNLIEKNLINIKIEEIKLLKKSVNQSYQEYLNGTTTKNDSDILISKFDLINNRRLLIIKSDKLIKFINEYKSIIMKIQMKNFKELSKDLNELKLNECLKEIENISNEIRNNEKLRKDSKSIWRDIFEGILKNKSILDCYFEQKKYEMANKCKTANEDTAYLLSKLYGFEEEEINTITNDIYAKDLNFKKIFTNETMFCFDHLYFLTTDIYSNFMLYTINRLIIIKERNKCSKNLEKDILFSFYRNFVEFKENIDHMKIIY